MKKQVLILSDDFDKLEADAISYQVLLDKLANEADEEIIIIMGSEYRDKYWIKNPESNPEITRMIQRVKYLEDELRKLKSKRLPVINLLTRTVGDL